MPGEISGKLQAAGRASRFLDQNGSDVNGDVGLISKVLATIFSRNLKRVEAHHRRTNAEHPN